MTNNELTPEQMKEIEEKIKNEISQRKSAESNQCYITAPIFHPYKTEEDLRRERINQERKDWFERTDGLSMGFHPEDRCNIF